jgi:His/Glu/Gln/Arg/opine family amino acid ABC transporter permease subunit
MIDVLAWGDLGFGDEIAQGAWLTIQLALSSLLFGLLLGVAAAAAMLSNSVVLRAIARGYVEIVRGVPEMLVVLIVYFGASLLLEQILNWAGSDLYIEVNAFAAGTFALGLVFGAFASEVIRGGFLAVPNGQIEAAIACGMSRRLLFWRIRVPQMWRYAIPGLGNLWLVLIKETSLISIIALDELLRWSKVAAEATKQPFTFYAAAALIYLLLAMGSDLLRHYLERRAMRGAGRAQ